MTDYYVQYGQWVVLILSILSLYLMSSVNDETRLNGLILTGVARASGASIFIFIDMWAFVIANLIQTIIAYQGYRKNRDAVEDKIS